MPCRAPGCVAEARVDGSCPVHAKPDGAVFCEKCHGCGRVSRFVEGTGRAVMEACDRCSGCGFKDKKCGAPRALKPAPVDDRDLMRLMGQE